MRTRQEEGKKTGRGEKSDVPDMLRCVEGKNSGGRFWGVRGANRARGNDIRDAREKGAQARTNTQRKSWETCQRGGGTRESHEEKEEEQSPGTEVH